MRRLDGADLEGASLPPDRTILCSVSDLDVAYQAEYSKGRIRALRVVEAAVEDADVQIEVASDDLIALAEGRTSLALALLTGRLRIEAHARDLLLLRQLF